MSLSHQLQLQWLDIAQQVADLSHDPYMKVGCVAITQTGLMAGRGYNDIRGINAIREFWENREHRRKFMIHAETMMIHDIICRGHALMPTPTVVITLFPCVHCMTLLAQFHVRELYYRDMYIKDEPAIEVAEFYDIRLTQIPNKDGVVSAPIPSKPKRKYCPDPHNCTYSDCPTAFCDARE